MYKKFPVKELDLKEIYKLMVSGIAPRPIAFVLGRLQDVFNFENEFDPTKKDGGSPNKLDNNIFRISNVEIEEVVHKYDEVLEGDFHVSVPHFIISIFIILFIFI